MGAPREEENHAVVDTFYWGLVVVVRSSKITKLNAWYDCPWATSLGIQTAARCGRRLD